MKWPFYFLLLHNSFLNCYIRNGSSRLFFSHVYQFLSILLLKKFTLVFNIKNQLTFFNSIVILITIERDETKTIIISLLSLYYINENVGKQISLTHFQEEEIHITLMKM